MIARGFPGPNVCFVLLMIVLTFPGCGRGISQFVTKPVQGSQNLSIDEITQMAGQSLQMMGYGIQEQDIPAGYIYARKRMVEDIYGRSTEIWINVEQGQVGEKVLGVEAFSCRGCIPEAHFSPSWMINQFYTYFDLVYKAAGRSSGTKTPPLQGFPPPSSISGSPPMTGKSAEGPLSAPPPNIVPTPGAATTMGSLKINKVEIDPTVVRAGSKFQIVADYFVADPKTEEKEIPVLFSLSILEGSKVLYAPKATEIKSYNNKSTIRREPITAGAKKGVYKIKVSIQYNNLSAEGAADLRIE